MIKNDEWIIESSKSYLPRPLITPFDSKRVSGASYDVALAPVIMIENHSPEYGDGQWLDTDLSGYSGFSLGPKEFILASIEETIHIPEDIACEFRLKSSRAREGWQHNLAVWADPGYRGCLTLELSNMNRFHGLDIYPGLLIGQLIFHQMSGAAMKPYGVEGRYQGAPMVEESKG